MECIRCGNKDPSLFYKTQRGYYCRCCIRFSRLLIEEDEEPFNYKLSNKEVNLKLKYELTKYQKEAANKTLDLLKKGQDTVLYCVTGAGKTEIASIAINDFLKRNKKVCYAIPRREVVIELEERFRRMFKEIDIVAVYGGHHQKLVADLVLCTTHQLYRYPKTFDLLVIDEADAYPLKGDQVLINITKHAAKGVILYSTATLDDELKEKIANKELQKVFLPLRPHLKPLIEPKLIYEPYLVMLLHAYKIIKRQNNPLIIFVPRKKDAERLYKLYKNFFDITYAYSDLKEREINIELFKSGQKRVIIATSLLERGITVNDTDVLILVIVDNIFDESSLIQMCGRAGRNFHNPKGQVTIISNFINIKAYRCFKSIREANLEALSILSKTTS